MLKSKELFELSEKFMVECDKRFNENKCNCPFYSEEKQQRSCPEFGFDNQQIVDNLFEMLEVNQDEQEMIVGEAILPHKFTSPNFVDCTFNDCEIYRYGMN